MAQIDLSVVIPALNEEKSIGICIEKAFKFIKKLGLSGEVVVADNGSTDNTAKISEKLGARVVHVTKKGYGNAYAGGLKAARGKYIVIGDADDSYNFAEIEPFYRKLEEGYEFVMGNRFKGKYIEGAMPPLHRYLGTPVLTGIMNLFFKTGIGDTNCGMRAFTKKAVEKMRLKTGGMEFATEMVIKASLVKLKIAEVPCTLYRDKRGRKPHLRTWSDGWRYLRFMLLFAPTWTFLIPGFTLCVMGILGMSFFLVRDMFSLDLLTFIGQRHILTTMMCFMTGFQILQLGIIAKAFSFSKHFDYASRIMRLLDRVFNLERGIIVGLSLTLFAFLAFLYLQISHYLGIFVYFDPILRFDFAVIIMALFGSGIQIIFSSFVLSLFYIKIK